MTNPAWPVQTDPPEAPQTETQFVRMFHAGLNTEAEFPASSVAMHAIAGWQVIDEPAEAEQPVEVEHVSRADVDAAKDKAAFDAAGGGGAPDPDADKGGQGDGDKPKTGTRRAGQSATTASKEDKE